MPIPTRLFHARPSQNSNSSRAPWCAKRIGKPCKDAEPFSWRGLITLQTRKCPLRVKRGPSEHVRCTSASPPKS